jgi:hypothetical protein
MTKILKKIGGWLRSIICNRYSNCYLEREGEGIAIFGLCGGLLGGDKHSDYVQYECIDCPYFVGINSDLKE